MPRTNQTILSDFYCTQCGKRGIPIRRRIGSAREAGHLKKLFCLNCQKETNHVECKPGSKYTYDDFLFEFSNKNFSENGERIHTYNELRSMQNET
jgi:hypothetical protein